MKRILAALMVCCAISATGAPKQRKKAPRHGMAERAKNVKPQPTFDAGAINNAATADPVGPDAAGNAVVRAQILLDRAHFSPGEIDGKYGDNLRVAIVGYQAAHNLPASGVIDPPMWQLLNSDTTPPLTQYTITPDDVKGPFTKAPPKMMDQAKLDSLNYGSPQEELGELFHANPELLKMLNPGKDLGKAGETIMVPNVRREWTVQAARVEVSKSMRTVSAYDDQNKLLAQYPATIGSEHDPLPIGDWKITLIKFDPIFNYNPDLFWDAKPEDSKAKIAPGPNNPVGLVWIGLSKEHYGIHGTPRPDTIGHTESHGCIRLTNWDAVELGHMVKVGLPAVLKD